MILTVINDTHVGAVRTGGTTPATAHALRLATLKSFRELLVRAAGTDLLINGDLFDTLMVALTDLWDAVEACEDWLADNSENHLYVSRGNHDIAKNSTIMSSFDLFCAILGRHHNFHAITEPTPIPKHGAYVIPHLPNQDLFNEALAAVPKCRMVFVHANYHNNFAMESDHSLNVSNEQAASLPCDFIVFGHEHQRKTALDGKVVIVGNQIPTSVADCLGNDVKYLLQVHPTKLEHVPVWEAKDDFARPDWRELDGFLTTARFVRVQGEASAAEASLVINAISKFRRTSDAFVVTNAVAIDGVQASDEEVSVESLKAFDVVKALLELLDEGFERNTVTNIIEKHNVQTSQAD